MQVTKRDMQIQAVSQRSGPLRGLGELGFILHLAGSFYEFSFLFFIKAALLAHADQLLSY
jgi:hypothetical protein